MPQPPAPNSPDDELSSISPRRLKGERFSKTPRLALSLSTSPPSHLCEERPPKIYNVQTDAAVLGNRLPGGTQKPLLSPGSLRLAGPALREPRKCLQAWHCLRCCHCAHGLLFRGSSGVSRGGQQQFATQTLRVHLLGIEKIAGTSSLTKHCKHGHSRASGNAKRIPAS